MEDRLPSDRTVLPEGLPIPFDDGAADHLPGMYLPDAELPSSMGDIDLGRLGARRAVLYIYPRTGTPSRPVPAGWDAIPGARGCTPQSCGFRDHAAEIEAAGYNVAGLSAQAVDEQREFASRMHMPFPVVSDAGYLLGQALSLPTFSFQDKKLYKRVTLIIEGGVIVKVFYPVFPPDRHAVEVLAWLAERRAEHVPDSVGFR